MIKQNELIGAHPAELGVWMQFEDLECTDTKRHRYLEVNPVNEEGIKKVSEWLVKHHLSENKKKNDIEEKKKF